MCCSVEDSVFHNHDIPSGMSPLIGNWLEKPDFHNRLQGVVRRA
jgi:hypothetical protein